MNCRILPTAAASGALNMALDEAMFQYALQESQACLRFYTWERPTVSLGYFQPIELLQTHPQLLQADVVRRHTGGGAIVHHLELTYCLALPPQPQWFTSENWLCRMHHIIQEAFLTFGVVTDALICGLETKRDPLLCFQHLTPGDLHINMQKIVGSAQRRPRQGLMQHGSILLAQSPLTPTLPGVLELSGISVAGDELQTAICAKFAEATSTKFLQAEWTADELVLAEKIAAEKYAHPTWTNKR
ncbi:MAG: biotin/lipoate A/B protein ligase family protein [Zavarzinella sp.]